MLAIGEAKWQEIMSASDLKRLEHIRAQLIGLDRLYHGS
jgi:hypothetical protein